MVGEIWDTIILEPMINILIVLSNYLFSSFGLTIIVLTIITRVLMLQLTLKQLRATKAMQSLQPQLAELQKKYAKNKQKLAQEQMSLYKESGVSATGCLVPMLVQMPIWIALYQSIIRVLAMAPEGFLSLSQYLYSWPIVYTMLPLASKFLWLDLATPNMPLALLVGGSMWLQQKMVLPVTSDSRQQATSSMMLWMMPMMFAFFALSFPSGLALYWVASNVISIVIQYYVTGWGRLAGLGGTKQVTRDKKYRRRIALQEAPLEHAADISADIVEPSSEEEEGLDYEEPGDKRQDSGGGYTARLREIRRQPGRGRSHRRKRR